MRKSAQVPLTLLESAALATSHAASGEPRHPITKDVRAAASIAAVQRDGFGESLASWWPLVLVAPIVAAFLIRFSSGGE